MYHVDGDIKLAIGLGDGHWGYEFNLENYFLGQTTYEWHGSAAQYAAEIAPARTVVLEEELEAVKQYGLGKGLDESSCLGIGFKSFLNEPRFPDEPTRHKMLDLIGDLALAGIPAQLLNVQAVRSGHKSNVVAAAKLAERVIIRRINSS